MKKIFCLLLILMLSLFSLFGCGKNNTDNSGSIGDSGGGEYVDVIPSTPATAYAGATALAGDVANGVGIFVGGTRFDVYKTDGGFSTRIVEAEGSELPNAEQIAFIEEAPITVRIKPAELDEEKEYTSKYAYIYGDESGVYGSAIVQTENGSKLKITDKMFVLGDFLQISRSVKVVVAKDGDEGFSSLVKMGLNGGSDSYNGMEYFIPGVWYKDASLNATGGIASSMRNKSVFVKDTRAGVPLIMQRNSADGRTIAIGRLNGEISSTVSDVDSAAFLTESGYKCGSVGVLRGPTPTVAYSYPCSEHPWVYQSSYSVSKRYHPIQKDFSSSFEVSLYTTKTADYNSAMQEVYIKYYTMQNKPNYTPDLDAVYDEVIKTFASYYGEHDTAYGEICGLPYGCFVVDGHVESGLTMEMGFVGMEISIAHQLMRYGMINGKQDYITKGKKMADMWAERSLTDSGVVKPYMYSDGSFSNMPCYLRRMNDGMEGLFDCVKFGLQNNLDVSLWQETLFAYLGFLVERQNEDGSWYRAYDYGGNVFSTDNKYGQKEDVNSVDADTKTCTPVPLRLLVRAYELTGEEKYLISAKKAANYVITTLYPSGKYAGSVCDGLERTDRETGIYTLYGMNALYEVTGDKQYLAVAEQAAVYVASWTMLTDFKIADNSGIAVGEYFKENASIAGQSLISTGHSGVDIFMAYTYYDFFKLYLHTGKEFYLDFSLFAQNVTKRNLNWQGNLGYYQKGLCLEATYFAEFDFLTAGTTGVWLPWSGNAVVEPMVNMYETFGSYDVAEVVKTSTEDLLAELKSYGSGGKIS